MDTGGLAQMTYNGGYYATPSFGAPAASYGSRGKGTHMKRLSVAPAANIGSIYEDEIDVNPTPRASRSHLLAGLRTAPRQPSVLPASAHYGQQQFDPATPGLSGRNTGRSNQATPQSAPSPYFPYMTAQNGSNSRGQQTMYCLPEQVLAPPDLNLGIGIGEQMDPEIYNNLMQHNFYLIQRQQQLQQQLLNVQAAAAVANQLQSVDLNSRYQDKPSTPQMSLYNQQAQAGIQPIVQPIANQPGLYSVYTPMTGQHTIYYDQDQMLSNSPPLADTGTIPSSPQPDPRQRHGPRESMSSMIGPRFNMPHVSPPLKASPSPPHDVAPLPPPSANAFRPGHRKSMSSANAPASTGEIVEGRQTADTRLNSGPRPATSGQFGPGMGRAGEHPVRQPRGPPPLDELLASPTSKHEGSKNFATRKRRQALHDLVRAQKERSGRGASSDFGTPTSEGEISFIISSDVDSEAGRSSASGSGNLSPIGSERRKILKVTSADGNSSSRPAVPILSNAESRPHDFAAAVKDLHAADLAERRRSPLLILSSAAEKRKSFVR